LQANILPQSLRLQGKLLQRPCADSDYPAWQEKLHSEYVGIAISKRHSSPNFSFISMNFLLSFVENEILMTTNNLIKNSALRDSAGPVPIS